MKLKDLESFLSKVKPFPKPKLHLEQYATDAHIAARMIYTAINCYDDIMGGRVVDFGCGCGMLSLACVYAGAASVLGIDVDEDALNQCRENMELLGIDKDDGLELIQGSVLTARPWWRQNSLELVPSTEPTFDVVVLNPPFGTKNNEGVDMAFLRKALDWAPVAYSMHKSSTRDYIIRTVRSWHPNCEVEVLAQMKFLIPRQFKFHREERVYVDVDLIRVARRRI